jgi:mannose-6-phosphate isomerase-like protein (cupin superfamily)
MNSSIEHKQCEILNPLILSAAVRGDYDNRSIASINDHEVRMSVMTAGFPWHRHPDSDETFLVVDGELVIEFEDRELILRKGDLCTVPRGIVHRTRPLGARSVNLTFERRDAPTEYL